jgi:hypothetical protein
MLSEDESLKLYPARLHVQGRPVIALNEPLERLYYRVDPTMVINETIVDVAAVRAPRTSVNAGSLCEPEDVLLEKPDWAVFFLLVRDAIRHVEPYDIAPEHDPLVYNYAHAEIRAYQAGHEKKNINNDRFRLAVRQYIADRLTRYSGTHSRCGATTKRGTQCTRIGTANGYCWQHVPSV